MGEKKIVSASRWNETVFMQIDELKIVETGWLAQ